jgi:protein phosphatase
MSFRFTYFSTKGKERISNSDYIQIKKISEGWIGVICDGIGDSDKNENPAKLSAETLIEFIVKSDELDPLKKLKSAIEKTNQHIFSHYNKISTREMTTTLAVLFLVDHTACWGHVGDSRIYKLKNGRLHRLTKDHSIIQQLVDKGFLTLKEAAFHTGINVVAKAIGEKLLVKVDLSKINLQQNDMNRFFLCTDGVTEVLTDKEIENCLRKEKVEECSSSLISLIEKYGLPDDTSFIIVDVL